MDLDSPDSSSRLFFQIPTQNRPRSSSPVAAAAAALLLLLCVVFFAFSSVSAYNPPHTANGTLTLKGVINANLNGALSLPVSGSLLGVVEEGQKRKRNFRLPLC